ncbi:hypothetical protein BXA22_10055 [Edwardsiella piscicida]|nr:hypothetical protein BXA22_10055 [Edwardsiella piscicida]
MLTPYAVLESQEWGGWITEAHIIQRKIFLSSILSQKSGLASSAKFLADVYRMAIRCGVKVTMDWINNELHQSAKKCFGTKSISYTRMQKCTL